ncbi:MAG TPA: DHA2 family efflux MFS transporter permease subunit [Terriglobales bacterium]|nr:DHA2 family efflux MFS transporter permease subunit [Terriglobales bacterium]
MTPINPLNTKSGIPLVNPWIVAITVMTSTFMEVLDTTVVNVSLPHIAGSLSSTPDEATWALTSYLVANAIILPMTGWLANYFGRKRLLMASVTGFTISSFLCGFAPNLPFLIFCRIIQGATGGGLQPLSQAILLEVFPPKDRGKAMAFWALGIVVAPMLGPVLGGWLTDSYSWRWVFYINVPIGILSLVMTYLFVFDPAYIKRATAKIDYWGIGLLAVGIGALQIMLDKGQEDNWFSSRFITTLAVLAIGGLTLFVVRELMAEHPVVDLHVFKNRSYATGVFLMTVLGFVLYGSTTLVPLLLQTLMGYSAVQAGVAMLPRGLGSFIMMPVVGILMSKIEARRLLGTGILVATFSFWKFSHLSLDVGYWNFFWPLIIQGASMGFLFVPLTTITNDRIPREKMGNATSLFNLMRNIGASIGIASVLSIQTRRAQVHTSDLSGHVSIYNLLTQNTLSKIISMLTARGSDVVTATHQAYVILFGMIKQQAAIMSYNDVFAILTLTFAGMFPLIFLMQRPKHAQGGSEVAMH